MSKKSHRARTPHGAAATPAVGFSNRSRAAGVMTLPSSSVQNEFGRVLDQARDRDIVVTRHDVPRAVLVSAERYRELVGREAAVLETLHEQFDALYARMQSPAAAASTVQGFRATPAEMGRAAVMAAQRTRPAPGPSDALPSEGRTKRRSKAAAGVRRAR